MSFRNYFIKENERPRDIAFNPLPLGTRYVDVSNTFLNGFINYVDICRAYCVNIHLMPDDEYEEDLRVMDTGAKETVWISVKDIIPAPITKNKVVRLLNEPSRTFHVKLDNDFQDDVLILAKPQHLDEMPLGEVFSPSDNTVRNMTLDPYRMWYFFWFSRTGTGCDIGRFATQDLDAEVIANFDLYAKEINAMHSETPTDPYLIQPHYFQGWIKN